MLSAVSFSACNPVGVNYLYGSDFKITQNLYSFADGFNMYITPALQNVRDISLNKQEISLLTDYINFENCIDQTAKTQVPIQVATTVQVPGVGYWACDGTNLYVTPDRTSENNIFSFKFDTETETLQVIFQGINYLTYDDNTNTLSFQSESIINFTGVSPQIFNYILDDKKIIIFTNFAFLSSQYTLAYNTSANVLSATGTLGLSGEVTDNATFYISEYPTSTYADPYLYGQSNWVQYDSNASGLTVKNSISGIPQNILFTSPYKTLSGNFLNVNINGLKNFLTPDFELNIDSNNNIKQRDYYGIFTGTNQEDGVGNVFLAYEGGTQGITFKKDKYTWFHYPNASTSISINDTTLALNGSIASNTPYKSDKVFKKKANYKKYSNWGESLPIYEQDGTWLCTWLSGSPDSTVAPVWIDRYINPTITSALSSGSDIVDLLLSTDSGSLIATTESSALEINGSNFTATFFSNHQQTYVDTESQLTFDPGTLYVYHHIGEGNNKSIVSQLSGATKQYYLSGNKIVSNTLSGTDQILFVGNWTLSATKDLSPVNNTINLVNTPNIQSNTETVYNTLFTNGSSYGITSYPIDFASYEGFVLSFNLYADDWSDLYGDQIIGNYFDGGIGLFVNNPVLTPVIYMYESTQGLNIELNSDLYILQESKLSNLSAASAVQFIFRRDYEEEYFVIDSGKNLLRYDSANILLDVSVLSGTITGDIYDAQIDSQSNLYILASSGAYSVNTDSGVVTYLFSSGNSTRIAVDRSNRVSILDSSIIDYCVDSSNNIFTVSNSGIYKNNTLTLSAANIKKIYCDVHDNIWVLHSNKLSKITNLPNLISTTTLPTSGTMTMTMGYTLTGNDGVSEYILIADETYKTITKLSLDNTITSTTAISGLSGQFAITNSMNLRFARGDSSGYIYQSKFGRIKQHSNGIHAKVYTTHRVTSQQKTFKLYADTSTLTKGWHNFTLSFDTTKGNVKLFIDGEIVARTTSDVNPYQFTYNITNYRNEPRVIIGTSPAKNGTLNSKIRQPGTYVFNGGFNEIRLYNKPLSDYTIRYISRNGFNDVYDDMVWNMPTGTNQYLEEIERFFQHRLPGNKSQFFNLKIRGYLPTNDIVQQVFEDSIRQVITKIVPAYTQLKDIIWVD